MKMYVGLHQPSDAKNFGRCMISVNRLCGRKKKFDVNEWMMDSGAFTELATHGHYRTSTDQYGEQVRRWLFNGRLVAAVSQDYMCEPFILAKTGLNVSTHQRLTIDRYVSIRRVCPLAYIMPVLQGYWPEEYVSHVRQYGALLSANQWVGVGSVCKRNSKLDEVEQVLMAIKKERPDLRLHGLGLKITALRSSIVRNCLHSVDSIAWSYSARKQGRNGNSWREAKAFVEKIENQKPVNRYFTQNLFQHVV